MDHAGISISRSLGDSGGQPTSEPDFGGKLEIDRGQKNPRGGNFLRFLVFFSLFSRKNRREVADFLKRFFFFQKTPLRGTKSMEP